jgi:hypothetical protein
MFHQEFGERDNYFFVKLGGFFEMRLSLSLTNKSFLTLDCHQEALLPSRVAKFERPVIAQHNQLENVAIQSKQFSKHGTCSELAKY